MGDQAPQKEWRGPLGWGLLLFGILERIIGWGGSIDFLISRSQNPGWVGRVAIFLLDHLGLWFIVAGVAFIVWNERRRTDRIVEARLGNASAPTADDAMSEDEAMMTVLGKAYHTFGAAIGSESRLQYDLALADTEHVLLAMARYNKMLVPELRDDGTPTGVYRALAYLNVVIPALRLNDVDEARRRAKQIVPTLNQKTAQDLHEEMNLPRYSMPPE